MPRREVSRCVGHKRPHPRPRHLRHHRPPGRRPPVRRPPSGSGPPPATPRSPATGTTTPPGNRPTGAEGVYLMLPPRAAALPGLRPHRAVPVGARRLVLLSSRAVEEIGAERLMAAERLVRDSGADWTVVPGRLVQPELRRGHFPRRRPRRHAGAASRRVPPAVRRGGRHRRRRRPDRGRPLRPHLRGDRPRGALFRGRAGTARGYAQLARHVPVGLPGIRSDPGDRPDVRGRRHLHEDPASGGVWQGDDETAFNDALGTWIIKGMVTETHDVLGSLRVGGVSMYNVDRP